jgi:hypothetical protein
MSNEELVASIFEYFNSGDLDMLSYALDYRFSEEVEFTSTALKDHYTPPNLIKLKGKKYIMLMWGLETELFPDAVWIETSSETTGGSEGEGLHEESIVVKKTFKFHGTRVFHPSTMALYEYVCYHAAIVDPLLAQPFTNLGNGVITILVPPVHQAHRRHNHHKSLRFLTAESSNFWCRPRLKRDSKRNASPSRRETFFPSSLPSWELPCMHSIDR